ncbi:MAG: MATE family efflux transporter [Saccharofermentanales bacterium]|jgi:putative MATE family efflux protein|nr:MATE family efflux transporter [Bacillota bacterium]
MSRQNVLGTEKINRLFWKLALPSVVAQVVNMLYNMVDRIYIGHIRDVGPLALTGVSISMSIIMLITAFVVLIGVGGAPRASIALGAGETEKAEKVMNTAMSALVVTSLSLTVIFIVFAEPLLRLVGASEVSLPYALEYTRIYVLGTPAVMLSMGLNYFISAQGFAATAMKTILIGAIANIILDPLFIFAFGLGVAGAAIATVISQLISACWVIHFLQSEKSLIRLRLSSWTLSKEYLLPILALGMSPFIMNSTESLLQIAFNRSLYHYGGDLYVGTMAINAAVLQMVIVPISGISHGTTSLISYNYGARNPERVKQSFRLLLTVTVSLTVLAASIIQAVPQFFTGLFTKDPELTAATISTMRIYCLGIFFMGFQNSCQQSFIAFGQARISMFMALLRKIILLIPLIFILPRLFSPTVYAIYWAEPIADFLAAAVTTTMFLRFFKKELAEMALS